MYLQDAAVEILRCAGKLQRGEYTSEMRPHTTEEYLSAAVIAYLNRLEEDRSIGRLYCLMTELKSLDVLKSTELVLIAERALKQRNFHIYLPAASAALVYPLQSWVNETAEHMSCLLVVSGNRQAGHGLDFDAVADTLLEALLSIPSQAPRLEGREN